MINTVLKNGYMDIEVVSVVEHDRLNPNNNTSIVYRINTKDYVVVDGLKINEDNTCTWNFAYQYDIESLTEATEILKEKIK